jgi:hypothetical protein
MRKVDEFVLHEKTPDMNRLRAEKHGCGRTPGRDRKFAKQTTCVWRK